ncbi:hypothetical protein QJS64_07765 [Paraclostridium bifermentans]|uniref:Uncharacterized protein n=1 Tax=Paraclostridium bifermentans TaxID=1490 RepID=A0ABY8R8D1_PARBF|nr:hypothetical protein QJS64_07765 [Paraclostridium bifermentans]
MILISISIVFNIIVFYFGIKFNMESMIPFMIMGGMLGLYKGVISDSLNSTFNITTFKYTLTKENIYELISSFLLSLSVFNIYIYYDNFNLIDLIGMIVFSLFIYRLLLFNLLKTANSKSTYI